MLDLNTRHTLLQRIKNQHDEQSWEDFVHFYEKFIYSIVRKSGILPSESEDITQNVLIKLWKCLPDFDYDKNKGNFRYWLFKVTKNIVTTQLKKELGRKEKFEEEYVNSHIESEKEAQSPEINQWIEHEWEIHICNLAYDNIKLSLSEKARKVFDLYMDEIPGSEISKIVGITENNVHAYCKRVRDKLLGEIKRLRAELE